MPPLRQPSTKPPPFNWVTYLDNYPELRENGIKNAKQALNHWNKYGKKEGRVYTKLESTESTSAIPEQGKPVVYIISNIHGGGSRKYLDDITNKYSTTRKFVNITTQKQLDSNVGKFKNSLIFLQHLILTDIKLESIIKIKETEQCKLIISIHDFYWICNSIDNLYKYESCHNAYLNAHEITILPTILKIFAIADNVICNSKFTYNIYTLHIPVAHYQLVYCNDYPVNNQIDSCVPKITDNVINIGIMHTYNICKGKELIEKLRAKYTNYKSYKIKWQIVGHTIPVYKENEFYTWLKRYNIHALTSLNKWGETWGYAMTKFINSGLPLIYNNFGAYKERFEGNDRAHYFKCYDMESEYEFEYSTGELNTLYSRFEAMLDFVIVNQGQGTAPEPITEIVYSDYYNSLFGPVQILPFAIYFPQFHAFPENDKNYYPGMTDMTNLALYFKENPDNPEGLERPDMSVYGLNCMEDYKLDSPELVNKQVELAKQNGIRGFAIYYYWFSDNTITGKHTIMEGCYNNFFKTPYDGFKVFLTWANEDWSANVAFNNPDTILNKYTTKNIFDNCTNLIKYFKHDNYYKINNKPVFGIHHTFLLPSSETIDEIYYTLNTLCIVNGFDGVNLILNSIVQTYPKYKNYLMQPNYKQIKYELTPVSNKIKDSLVNTLNSKTFFDYTKYIDLLKLDSTCINTICFDFNNTARMYKPDNSKYTRRIINNPDKSKQLYITKIKNVCYANAYSPDELDRIVLVNAWNEWGKKMHIEPSIESGTNLLDMLKILNT